MKLHNEQDVQDQDASQQKNHGVKSLGKIIFIAVVRFYQKCISPMFPPTCRYMPTCSEYAIIAVQRYGFMKGFVLAAKRILRCHPFHEGGYDPVP